MYPLPTLSLSLSLLSLLLLLPSALSQNTSTYNSCTAITEWLQPNASASYPIPGLIYNNDTITNTTESNWTLSITLTNWTTTGAGFSPYFWLSPPLSQPGSPVPNLTSTSQQQQLPYAGCAATIYGFPDSVNAAGQTDNGDCTKMLDKECVSALQAQLLAQAKGVAATENTTLEEACQTMLPVLNSVPDACTKFWAKGAKTWPATISTSMLFAGLRRRHLFSLLDSVSFLERSMADLR